MEPDHTSDNLLRLAAGVDDCLRQAITPQHLTVSQFEVLEFLATHAGTEISELLARTGYQKSTLSRMLRTLRNRKLITLGQSDSRDSRRRVAAATERGAEVVQQVLSDLAVAISNMLQEVPLKKKAAFFQKLDTVTRRLPALKFGIPLPGAGTLWRYPRLSSPREAATERI